MTTYLEMTFWLDGGEQVTVDLKDLDGLEWRELRKVTSLRAREFGHAIQQLDIEAIAALLWVVRRRDDPDLDYETVLKATSMASLIPPEAAEEDDPGPPD